MPRIFYGWIVVLAGGIVGGMNSGFFYYGFGAFFNDIIAEMHWSRAELSGAFSIARLESGIVGPLAGYLIDRFGPRAMMSFGLVIIGIGFVLLSQAHDLVVFYLIFIVFLSVGNSFGTSLPSMAAVSNWFLRRRGLAVGVMMAIFGIGGGVGVPVLGWLITTYGWRNTTIIAGVAFWVFGLPVARLIVRRPEEKGMLPDGGEAPGATLAHRIAAPVAPEPEFTALQALRLSAFWMLSMGFTVRFLVASAIAVHEAPFLRDRGYSAEVAAALLGGTILISVAGRLFFGWLGDKVDRRFVLIASYLLMGAGVFVMTLVPDVATSPVWHIMGSQIEASTAFVMVFVTLFGFGYGGTVPVSIAIVADYFGRRRYATIQGTIGVVTMVGNVVGPVVAGYAYDVSSSYTLVLTLFAALCVLGIPFFLLARRPTPPSVAPAASGAV